MNMDAHSQLLMSRIVDGDASEQEWSEFELLSQRHPQAWRELAEAQRDHAALVRGISSALALADATPLPEPRDTYSFDEHRDRFQQRLHRLSAWAGWAVAAVLVLALTPVGQQFRSSQKPVQAAGFMVDSPDDALNAYKQLGARDGRVLGEVPTPVMVQSSPISGRGYEVIYLRQIVEKVVVDDLYQFAGTDERGQPTPVRWQMKQVGSM